MFNVLVVRREPAPGAGGRSVPRAGGFSAALAEQQQQRARRSAATWPAGARRASAARATPASAISRAPIPRPGRAAAFLGTPGKRALAAAIERASRGAGVAPELSLAVAMAESSLDPTVRSSDGKSEGTFQVTRPTAADVRRRLARGELTRPPGSDDVALGVAHLRYLDDLFHDGGNLGAGRRAIAVGDAAQRRQFAVAAYNAGEGRVSAAQARAAALGRDPRRFENIRIHLPAITRRYVDRVMTYAEANAPARVAIA